MMQVHVLINTREIVNVLDVYAEIHKKKQNIGMLSKTEQLMTAFH